MIQPLTGRAPNRLISIVIACSGAMAAQMCLTITAPLTGLYQSVLGASASNLTWLTAASFAPTAILELNFGVLGDLFGRKRLVVGGAACSSAGALVAMFAQNVDTLYVAMVLLGLGAAALLPSTLATVAHLSSEPSARVKVLARWALSISFGAALSPLLAGILGQHVGLHAAFVPLFVVCAATTIGAALLLEDTSQPEGRALDWRGQGLCGVGLIALIFAVIQGADKGWGSAEVIVAFIVAAIALPAFVVAELRHPAPMFQIRLLTIPAFRAAAVTGFLGMLSFLGVAYAISIKLGPIAGAKPVTVALPFVIIQIVPLVFARWLPGLLHRYSPRTLLVSGLLVMAAGEVWFAALADGETHLLPMVGPIALMGVGFIVMFSSLTAAAINSVPHEAIGMASGATSLVRETGQTLGSAVLGAIALTHASKLATPRLDDLDLSPQSADIAHGVNASGGPLALANAPLPKPLASAVQPVAHWALERGFDLGLLVMAGCAVLAALTVVVLMHGSGAAKPVDTELVLPSGEELL